MSEAPEPHKRADRPSGGTRLLDRDAVLDLIDSTVNAAAAGGGPALLLVGHSGMGKTRLHEAAVERAQAKRLRVARAAGAELEQNLAFGVAGQLVRSLLSQIPASQRRTLMAQVPQRVLSLDRAPASDGRPAPDDHVSVAHEVFSVLAAAAEKTPALLAIDDLQWADSASLEVLLYVLHRLDELQVALVMTRHPAVEEAPTDPLTHIASHPKVRVENLVPLGQDAIASLIGQFLGADVDSGLAAICRDATAGNPFFVQELLRALAEDPHLSSQQLLARARSLVPEVVSRSLRVRVGRLGHEAAALARIVAVLGEDVPLRHAAVLSGLSIAEASRAADTLSGAEVLLAREPLRFVHPLVRKAIEQDIPASEQASRHLDAARLLYDEGAGVERVAAHLLLGRAEGSSWVVERLRAAAHEARATGASRSVVRYLERALAEPPSREERPVVLGELGAAEVALGMPGAAEHLAAAGLETADPRHRAELALDLARAYGARGEQARAAEAFEQGLGAFGPESAGAADRELFDQLQAGFIATATLVPAIRPRAIERATEWLKNLPAAPATQGQRLLLAHVALESAHRGDPAEHVIELAERAWDEGRVLSHASPQWIGWRLVANALISAGALERAVEVSEAAIQDARRRASPPGFATASFIRSIGRLFQGRVNDAVADLESARDARRYGWGQFARGASAQYALCLIELERPGEVEAVLTEDAPLQEPYDLEDAMRLYALAELYRGQGRHEDALRTALLAGEAGEGSLAFFDYCRWRTCAAQAAVALGDRERGLALSGEMLARAEATGISERRVEALRVMAICEGGETGIEKLRQAAELGRSSPPRLETIRALVDLGAALRRSGERTASRAPLQEAADLARHGGALLLYHRARTELAASGARPRRELLLSGPASLTPSERRIAELAAGGQSNRQIATMLFVTPKTVEYHLRNAYRKLDIQTRRQLAKALAG